MSRVIMAAGFLALCTTGFSGAQLSHEQAPPARASTTSGRLDRVEIVDAARVAAAVSPERAAYEAARSEEGGSEEGGIAGGAFCAADCAGAGDGQVNIQDLLALLSQWNSAGSCDIAPAGGNGVVNIQDLLALLSQWGPCPTCGPGAGPCFQANGTPGCNSVPCCQAVCAIDPFCCDVSWDSICAGEALTTCTLNAACPGTGVCFQANGTPGCQDGTCCNIVCEVDSFCCNIQWDDLCADQALDLCAGNAACPGIGNCYAANGSVACDNGDCCDIVCEVDPFCCTTTWDSICAGEAVTLCAGCGIGNGPCFQAHLTPGCQSEACCGIICALDPYCCNVMWDSLCATEALANCAANVECPGAGTCFQANGTPGCQDGDCCNIICEIDPFCCNNSWDSICAGEALELCAGNASCPGAGACTQANGTPGCQDEDCCNLVCEIDPFCCITQWDSICASEAQQLCSFPLECSDPFDCFGGGNAEPCFGGPPGCFCFTGFDGNPVCGQDAPCGGLTLCPDGDCPPGFVCVILTCCNGGDPVCIPECAATATEGIEYEPGTLTTTGVVKP